MSETQFTFEVSDVVKAYSEKDFERQYAEPRDDMFFEFEIANAQLGQAKVNEAKGTGGYLQMSWKVNALGGDGKPMFSKFINLALPVVFRGHKPFDAAASILSSALKAVMAEVRAYDEIAEDPIDPKKKVYLIKGQKVEASAFKAAEKAQGQLAKTVTDKLLDPATQADTLKDMVGRRFFARVQKDGEYSNVKPIIGVLGPKDQVCYNRDEAFSK